MSSSIVIGNLKIAYLAGVFDGEGCISVSKSGQIRCVVQMACVPILLKFKKEFGGSISIRKPGANSKKVTYTWNLCGINKVCDFLMVIEKFLCEKRSQALAVITHIKSYPNNSRSTAAKVMRQNLYIQMALMKREEWKVTTDELKDIVNTDLVIDLNMVVSDIKDTSNVESDTETN